MVTDDSDECPNTPKDETVDDSGCSESQKDTDKDGVSDNLDQSAETPEGKTVGEEGCSESKKIRQEDELCAKLPGYFPRQPQITPTQLLCIR